MIDINSLDLAIMAYLYKIQVMPNNQWRNQLVQDGYLADFQDEQATKFTKKAIAEFDNLYKSKNGVLLKFLRSKGEASYISLMEIQQSIQVPSEFYIEFLLSQMKSRELIKDFNLSVDEENVRVIWN